jgi:hypothetical protein
MSPLKRLFRDAAAYRLILFLAVFGTAVIEAVVSPLYRPHSGQNAILKAWILDVTVAALIATQWAGIQQPAEFRQSSTLPLVDTDGL